MSTQLEKQAVDGKKIVLYTSADPRIRTNAACLLASWLVLELDWTAEVCCVQRSFHHIPLVQHPNINISWFFLSSMRKKL
jgi:hypothetical protein